MYLRIATILSRSGSFAELGELAEKLLSAGGCNPQLISQLAVNLHSAGLSQQLKALLLFTRERWPEYALAWYKLAGVLREGGDLLGAEVAFRQSIFLQPDHADAFFNPGKILLQQGRPAKEWEPCLHKALELDNRHTLAHLLLAFEKKHLPGSFELTAVEVLLKESGLQVEDRENLLFARGKILENQHDYEKAFASFNEANRLHRHSHPYDREVINRLIAALENSFTTNFPADHGVGRYVEGSDRFSFLACPDPGRTWTLSAGQVRRPIYNDSLSPWRRYHDSLAPLAAALGELAGTYTIPLPCLSCFLLDNGRFPL